jgi:hypothetical protein
MPSRVIAAAETNLSSGVFQALAVSVKWARWMAVVFSVSIVGSPPIDQQRPQKSQRSCSQV